MCCLSGQCVHVLIDCGLLAIQGSGHFRIGGELKCKPLFWAVVSALFISSDISYCVVEICLGMTITVA